MRAMPPAVSSRPNKGVIRDNVVFTRGGFIWWNVYDAVVAYCVLACCAVGVPTAPNRAPLGRVCVAWWVATFLVETEVGDVTRDDAFVKESSTGTSSCVFAST